MQIQRPRHVQANCLAPIFFGCATDCRVSGVLYVGIILFPLENRLVFFFSHKHKRSIFTHSERAHLGTYLLYSMLIQRRKPTVGNLLCATMQLTRKVEPKLHLMVIVGIPHPQKIFFLVLFSNDF